MTNKRTYSLAEVESLTGIPAEEIHSRIWRGELPGDGNVAMPGNRRSGTVNAETFEGLYIQGQLRREPPVVVEAPRRNHFKAIPLDQAALELEMTRKDLEALLINGELEGPVLNHRYTGVTHESMAAYLDRERYREFMDEVEVALQPADLDAKTQEAYASREVKVEYLSMDSLKSILTRQKRR